MSRRYKYMLNTAKLNASLLPFGLSNHSTQPPEHKRLTLLVENNPNGHFFKISEYTLVRKSQSPDRRSSMIDLKDFWSSNMKAKVHFLQKNRLTQDDDFSVKKQAKKVVIFPILEDRFKRSNMLTSSPNCGMVPKSELGSAIEKIINECNSVSKATRRLNYQMTNSTKNITNKYLTLKKLS